MTSSLVETTERPAAIPEEDALRADLYDFLAALLSRPPDADRLAQTAALSGGGGTIGAAVDALARVARASAAPAVAREYQDLFIGLGRGELLPYASYYMTGFLNEKPLAKLRNDMLRLSMVRAETVHEPEDNIASLCEMMAGLIRGRFGAPSSLREQRDFFNTHLAPWAEHFFSDLEAAETSVFYAPVGTLGRAFIGVEREAFRLEG